MSKYTIVALITLVMTGFLVPSALGTDDGACPLPSQEFGQHIADMAPECPQMDGQMFGEMVSDMARGIPCPHIK